MKETPLLFSGPMIRAILEGRKTQTRRAVKVKQWAEKYLAKAVRAIPFPNGVLLEDAEGGGYKVPYSYGQPRDRIWVREAFYQVGHWEQFLGVKTKTGRTKWKFVPDSEEIRFDSPDVFRKGRHSKDPYTVAWHKRLARFMPRKASRITLEIVSVEVERLQDISEEDAKAEGCLYPAHGPTSCYRSAYKELWESIHGKGSWALNPFVWVIRFKRL